MNTITLRPYQQEVLNNVEDRISKREKEIVIAVCPSGGKTIMAIDFILRHNSENILVLTHGTNVIKDQWANEFKEYGVVASDDISTKCKVKFGLPHGFFRKDTVKRPFGTKKTDYLIIDESHEYTEADMIVGIIKALEPRYIIYLTGTPSKHIAKGLKPIIIPALDLVEKGYISDLYLSLVSSKVRFTNDDFNDKQDLKIESIQTLEKNTKNDVDELIKEMVKRLKEPNTTKQVNGLGRLNTKKVKLPDTISYILGRLDKTMIACASVKQAELVHKCFNNMKISSILSHSNLDLDSSNITKFMNDSDIKVLIVVDRGILGFNMPELVNVVDFTGSRNINRIYQLYARVMRKSDKHPHKYFFKLTNVENQSAMAVYMTGSLCLMNKDFIEKYNGKNFNDMEVPVLSSSHKIRKGESATRESIKKKPLSKIKFPDFYSDVPATGVLLKYVAENKSDTFNEFAFTRIADIKKHFGERVNDSEGNKQKLLELAKSGADRPKRNDKLGIFLNNYISNGGCYDTNFHEKIKGLAPHWFVDSVLETKNELIEAAKKGQDRPKHLKHKLEVYLKPKSVMYDEIFAKQIKELAPHWFRNQVGYWTLERCKESALKFTHRAAWYRGEISAYSRAYQNNWLDQCTTHMINPHHKKVKRSDGVVYKSLKEATRLNNLCGGSNISQAIKNNHKAAGYYWSYIEGEE
jgi:superfamily II DNA or RNA helicase